MVEKGAEDIMDRLEALRRRAPEEGLAPPGPSGDDGRRRLARIVGLLVILVVLGGGTFFVYNIFLKAPPAPPPLTPAAVETPPPVPREAPLPEVKAQVVDAVNRAFEGLPLAYSAEKRQLITRVNEATTSAEVRAVDYEEAANRAWRSYWIGEVQAAAQKTGDIELKAGNDTYRTTDVILQKLNFISYTVLKTASLRAIRAEYVPLRLTRLQAAGGMVEIGDVVNVYHKEGGNISILSRRSRVMAILRGKESGSINLAESERKMAGGEGSEGKGSVSSVTGGSISSVEGPFPASAGYKMSQTQSTYTVSIEEVQKVAAASKLPDGYIENALESYGIKLNKIERETNIGNMDAEYLILLEVGSDEAPGLVSKVLSPEERKNLFITMSEPSLWMKAIK